MVSVLARPQGKVIDLFRLREIKEDCLCFRVPGRKHEREYQAVIQVDPLNFSLMSQGEQEAISEGYRSFLAGQTPRRGALMYHLRTTPYDINPYIEKLQAAQRQAHSDLYRLMAADHEHYMKKLANDRALLHREFYVRASIRIDVKAGKYRRLLPEEVFDEARSELLTRCQALCAGLARAGWIARRLVTEELVLYTQSCIHSQQAKLYALPASVLATLDYPIKAIGDHQDQGSEILPDTSRALSLSGFSTDMTVLAHQAQDAGEAEEHQPVLAVGASGGRRQWVSLSSKAIERMKARQARKRREDGETDPLPDFLSLPELLAPASVEQTAHYIKIHANAGDEYLRARAVVGYPAYALAGWFDELLAFDEPYLDALIFIEPLDATRHVRALTRNISGFRATQLMDLRHGKTEDPYINEARAEVETLREKLVQKTEQLFHYSLYLLTRASDRQTLKERDRKLTNLLHSLELHSVPLQLEHAHAWLSCVDGIDLLKRARKFDTSTLVAGLPFCSSNLSTEPGTLVGVAEGGSLVIIDPASDQLENGHELVFAKSGAGKSYYRKIELARALLVGYEAIVVDPDREEYLPLAMQFGGTYLRLAAGNLHLNPFDLPTLAGENRNILEEHFQNLLALFDVLLAEKIPGVLSQKEKGILVRLFTLAYARRGITSDPSTHGNAPPNMRELYEILLQEYELRKDRDLLNLGDRLLRHLPNFPDATSVELDNPLVVFSLNDLPDELRPVALYLVTQFVWSQARKERLPRPRLLCIDEAWVLMEFPEGGRFLASISRRARKYNLHLRLVTQNAEDFLSSEHGRTILLNASQRFLMKQDSTTIDAVARAFKLSDEERKYLLGAEKGEGLYFCRTSHVPLKVIASDLEHRLANTNAQELRRQEQVRVAALFQEQVQHEKEAIAVARSRDEFQVVLPRIYRPVQSDEEEGSREP